MDALGGDVLDVVMADLGRELGDRGRQVFADAEGVTDVEVQADRRRVDPFGDFEVLVGRLQEQLGLGLDQEEDAKRFKACSARGFRASTNRSIAWGRVCPSAISPPARSWDVGRLKLGRERARRVW